MDVIARTPVERAELFQETAARRGVDRLIIEKDFWVCWTLKQLFSTPNEHPSLLFLGGTSLSKFRLIKRFSDDIDISLDRHDLGFEDERDPANAPSQKKADKLLRELGETTVAHLRDILVPHLSSEFAEKLGNSDENSWSLDIDPDDPLVVLFSYPSQPLEAETLPSPYVQPLVRLEFGARSDHWPSNSYEIEPYAAEEFPDLFEQPAFSAKTLEAERTFWEKATLLHAEYYREKVNPGRKRISRHYYDVAMLARSRIRNTALTNVELLTQVANHKMRFFRAGWAKYELARVGTLKLAPHDDLAAALKLDYGRMREMFFDEPPDFDEIVGTLAELEEIINGETVFAHPPPT